MTNDSAKGYAYLAMIAVGINKKDVMNVMSEIAERMGFGDE